LCFPFKFIPLCTVDVTAMISGYSILWEFSSSKHGRSGLDAGFGQESGKSPHRTVGGDGFCSVYLSIMFILPFLGHCILWDFSCSIFPETLPHMSTSSVYLFYRTWNVRTGSFHVKLYTLYVNMRSHPFCDLDSRFKFHTRLARFLTFLHIHRESEAGL